MIKRRSSTLTRMALEVFEGIERFSTAEFAREIGSSISDARKALKYQSKTGKVQALPQDFWIVVKSNLNTSAPNSNPIQDQIELINKAFASIQTILEENRWLRKEVEKWAAIARQAKIYHNGANND